MINLHNYIKPVPDLFIADWLSRKNHKENKDEEINGMQVNINHTNDTHNYEDPRIHDDT